MHPEPAFARRLNFPRLVPPPAPDDTHDWRTEATCREVDPDLFYPAKSVNPNAARRICRECPVVAECLTAGMDERHGIWGGKTPQQRARMRTRARKAESA